MPEISILDARLAEIDRRLRTIQSGLAPAAGSPSSPSSPDALGPPDAPPSRQESDGTARLVGMLRELVDAQERLLASARKLLSSYDVDAADSRISVSAGPFAGTEALRRFERSVAAIPEVREVVVREYTGDDRVVLDVLLSEPIS
jgi:hypothetical protein